MTHLSKKKLPEKTLRDIEERVNSFLVETGSNKRKKIFSEIITNTERHMIAKRLAIIFLLQKGKSIFTICKALGVSPSTVERFSHKLASGNLRHTAKWVRTEKMSRGLIGLLSDLVEIPLGVQKKSLSKWIDES